MKRTHLVVLMGVAGSGKTTVGKLLASKRRGVFRDADEFHPEANILKMASGIPLDDEDRRPWLERLRREVVDAAASDEFTVLACSALKEKYRTKLGVGHPGVALVYLRGDISTLAMRLDSRKDHFMNSQLLESQFDTLEEPSEREGITVDIEGGVEEIVTRIEQALGLPVK